MTSKDYLSQEEIDALLKQSSGESETEQPVAENAVLSDFLTPIEQDALGEIGNITFGSAATALSTLLGKKVDITTPEVTFIRRDQLSDEFPKPHVAVSVQYVDGFEGINSLVIKTKDAQVIADLMLGGEGEVTAQELNEIHISAVQEAMNQMMGSSATSMSTIFNRFVNISPPGIDILDVDSGDGMGQLPPVDIFIKISFRLTIGELIDSTIMQLLPVSFAKQMVSTLMGGTEEEPASAPAPAAAPSQPQQPIAQQPAPAAQTQGHMQAAAASQMQQQPAYFEMPGQPQGPQTYGDPMNRGVNVQPVQFANFNQPPYVNTDETNLNLLLDIPLKVTVELGRTQKQIKDILELSQGSIIELDKLAGEPVDILVNNKLIAKGEVVVIDENFGVRVTDIVSQWDRIQKLQ
ncbi:flagellar motor switch phosphatase FliY [Paenibacillus radicis (ex Gao et al. 2016)]|uniref:Flagellar motor switch phosphatase FliY n=1 Tax=Paenibacillus radicis (ex Gao et al. 2016) TaxID=1737354 RepID=A0A917HK28_9BACL|nr:flagellar motor switch phosphatase FliY [Paenibacillus radicis (ex Gao et al. 2016)]GGG80715.1 flagellar motor switch phosphatase FliY [Paenibacillus radicis (ex Gao et al. 2016)]